MQLLAENIDLRLCRMDVKSLVPRIRAQSLLQTINNLIDQALDHFIVQFRIVLPRLPHYTV